MKEFLFNIQLFNESEEPESQKSNEQKEDKGISQEQVNEIVSKRLAKEKAKWEKEYNTKLEQEKAEAQRLANMDAEQRKQAELEKRIKELEERESAIKMQEIRMETAGVLKDRGLSESFVDMVIGQDNELTLQNINALEKAFNEAVKLEVEKRLPSYTPESGNDQGTGMTKEQFRALPLSKQNELYMSNPELYRKFF